MIQPNSSLEFRERFLKVVKENLFLKNDLSNADRILLAEEYKSLIDSINGFIVICNYTTGLYEYISEGIRSYLGYDLKDYSNEELTIFVGSIIHEDHLDFMMDSLIPIVFNYFKENSTFATGTDYRYTCSLKVKNIYNEYQWYLIDTNLLEVDDCGLPLRTLITCTNINQFKKDDSVYYNISKKNNHGVYELLLEGTLDNRMDEFKLTSREIQVVNLVSRGNTNQQIADQLFISVNTVQTHRKNILKKTRCKGTAELTSFAFSRGLL